MTAEEHQSGSDRIAEVAANLPENSIIVNVQADEPLISPQTIEKAVEAICADQTIDVATTCEKISDIRDVLNPNTVKVVVIKMLLHFIFRVQQFLFRVMQCENLRI
jgi:3-deoxy-manno-octulosonate cytidylyltransferase (CMP-KDO synthetase)